MIHFIRGNLFESHAEALVNTVNCVGVMGKGIAYQFRRAFPEMYLDYERRCQNGEVQLGNVTSFREKGRLIINFPTKGHWRSASRLEDIRAGLASLKRLLEQESLRSIALPPLGCGNGGLQWTEVRPLIVEAFNDLEGIQIEVYEPAGHFESEVATAPKLSLSHYVLLALRLQLQSDKKLDMQKAAYFFNVFWGEPYFRFVPHKFGPYCAELERLMLSIKDALDHSGMSATQLLDEGLQQKLRGVEADRLRSMLPVIQRSTALCNRALGQVEALATAHAVVAQQSPLQEPAIIDRFLSWSPEKAARFQASDVLKALETLEREGLLTRSLLGYTTLSFQAVPRTGSAHVAQKARTLVSA